MPGLQRRSTALRPDWTWRRFWTRARRDGAARERGFGWSDLARGLEGNLAWSGRLHGLNARRALRERHLLAFARWNRRLRLSASPEQHPEADEHEGAQKARREPTPRTPPG